VCVFLVHCRSTFIARVLPRDWYRPLPDVKKKRRSAWQATISYQISFCHANVAAAIFSQKLYITAIVVTDPATSKVRQRQGVPGIQPSPGLMSPPLPSINGKIQAQECLACNSHECMSPPPTRVWPDSYATAVQCQLLVARLLSCKCCLFNIFQMVDQHLAALCQCWLCHSESECQTLAAFAASPFLIEGM